MVLFRTLWRFSRPHTVIGTITSVVSIFIISVGFSNLSPSNIVFLITALVFSLSANIYIVGLNQFFDMEVDKINKPELPLASGALSPRQAVIIIVPTGIFSFGAYFVEEYLFLTVLASLIIGSLYSIPPIRLRRFPLLASLSIISVRGLIVNLGFYLSFQHFQGLPLFPISPIILLLTLSILVLSLVIALFKDLPDISGDQYHSITTFAQQLGKDLIFRISIIAIVGNFILSFILAFILLPLHQSAVIMVLDIGILTYVLNRAKKTDISLKQDIKAFYYVIWIVFYAQYLGFALI